MNLYVDPIRCPGATIQTNNTQSYFPFFTPSFIEIRPVVQKKNRQIDDGYAFSAGKLYDID